jgi:aminoglycoside 6-adenylyltransferase
MHDAYEPDEVLQQVTGWADAQEPVRALLLTSTRATPHGKLDRLSDYDVILVVQDARPFFEDRSWLETFGEVLVAYWDPITATECGEMTGNVIQFAAGLKIDFTLLPTPCIRDPGCVPGLLDELDAGYRVLLDKDGLTAGLPPPTYAAYIPARPSEADFRLLVEEFLTDPPYVAKCLLRDELLPAKWCLDHDMKHVYLRRVLEWRAQLNRGWSQPIGALGKGLKGNLPPDIWAHLERSYAGADVEQNWEALFATAELFRRVAAEVGEHLGYSYPHDLHQRVMAYVQTMRQEGL